jgi:hypothetical protein
VSSAEEVQDVLEIRGDGGFKRHTVELERVDKLEAEGVEGLAGDQGRKW